MASSNTMELNSILEEARKRKNGTSVPAPAPTRSNVTVKKARSFEDDFVLTDDYEDISSKATVKKPRSTARPAAAKTAQKPKKKTGLIIGICVAVAVVLVGIGGLIAYLNSGSGEGPDARLSKNITVNGVSIGDKTPEEARGILAGIENQLADEIHIIVKAGDKSYNFTKDNFKYSFNTEDILNQAKAYSEEKGIKSGTQNYDLKITFDKQSCADVISAVAKEAKADAKNATVTAFDPSASNMFTIANEVKGVALDEEKSLAALTGFVGNGNRAGTVEATVKTVDPKYTAAFLKDNIKKLSSFSTYSSNNSNGNENMRVSLAACNGSIVNPGETWSFNNCTGDSNLESNGYKPAGVIVEGRSETGVGGGICQSSTTIYNAAILAGMKVEERECHYYKSVYVDAGLDATVDYGNIDLKLSNPFEYQLFIKCWMDDVELNCEIYGLENPEFDSISISTSDATYFDNGFRVSTYRTYLKDGKEVKKDDLPSSTYYFSAPSSGGSSSESDTPSSSGETPSSSGDAPSSSEDPGSGSGEESGGEEPGGEEPGGDEPGGDEPGGEEPGGEEPGGEEPGGEEPGGEEP